MLCSSIWSEFEPINLVPCNEIGGHLKPTILSSGYYSTSFPEKNHGHSWSWPVIGLLLTNACQLVPSLNSLTFAVVMPYLKKNKPGSFLSF